MPDAELLEAIARAEALAAKATPGPWEWLPDTRPDVVYAGLRDWWHDATPEERGIWMKVVERVMRNGLGSVRTSSGDGGYWDGGQIAMASHKYPGHIVEFAKYWAANDDAEFVAEARTLLPLLAAALRERLEVSDA